MAILITINLLYFNQNKVENIFERFERESPISNVIGNLVVLVYIILSVYLCFWVALPFLSEIVRTNQG